jgi:predicted aspartyl protease
MFSDPFLGNVTNVGNFDGNPTTNFEAWYERFSDVLSLSTTALSDVQKLARLRYCLKGQARAAYDSINPAPADLNSAFNALKIRFNNKQTKILARQSLSICKQAPNESVFSFTNRLTENVKAALDGETNDVINRRLLDEFLERLLPDLQFEVNSHIDVNGDFVKAYELALHFELLLASKRKSVANISVNELAAKVDILAIQQKEWRDYGASGMNNYENNGYFNNEAQYNNRDPQYYQQNDRYDYNNKRRSNDGNYQHNRENDRYNNDYNQRRCDKGLRNEYSNDNNGRMFDSRDRMQYAYRKNGQRDEYFSRNYGWDDHRDDERRDYRERGRESPQARFQDIEYPEVGVAIPFGDYRSPSPLFKQREPSERQRYSQLPEVRVSSPIREICENSSEKGGQPAKKYILNEINAVNISNKCDDKSCISAELNGVKVNCLLDTGAHTSLMSVKTAKKLGIQSLSPANFSAVIGIGDDKVPTVGQTKINLKVANSEVKTNIMVINRQISKNGSYEVILGRESLKLLPLTLNLMTGELSSINGNNFINMDKISIVNRTLESSAERGEESINDLNEKSSEWTAGKQKFGEKVVDFADRLLEYSRRDMNGKNGKMVKSQLLETFLDGLSNDLYVEVAKKMPKTFEEAYDMAQLNELLNEKYKATKNRTNSANAVQRGRKIRICYFCRKPGHFINNCPEKREDNKTAIFPRNDFQRMGRKAANEFNRCENWRDHNNLNENSRCKNEINNWRNQSCNEPENWRNMFSLKSEQQGRVFNGANWRKLPERKIAQRGRMCEDANWREMPLPEVDQCVRTLKDMHCDGMDRDVQ